MGYQEQVAKAVTHAEQLGTDDNAVAFMDQYGAEGLARFLNLRVTTWRTDFVLEALTNAVFNVQIYASGSYPRLLARIATAWMESPIDTDFTGWSHSLCHLFERYYRGGKEGTFLDAGLDPSAVAALAGNAVDRAIAHAKVGCADRIVGPMMKYSLDQLTAENLDDDFAVLPASANNRALADMLNDEYYAALKVYLRSALPRPLVIWMVINGEYIDIPADRLVGILAAIKLEVGDKVFDAYLTKYLRSTEDPTSSIEAIAALASSSRGGEVVEGVFVDVDGVLITDSKLNDMMLQELERHAAAGEKIIVFSGGDPTTQAQALRALGFPEKFLPVQPKSAYRGKILDTLYDDTLPEFQGFACRDRKPVYGVPYRYKRF